MYYSRKRPTEDIPQVSTPIWSCTDENCRGWMRDNFVFSSVPVCSICQSEMVRDEKMLAVVVNTSPIQSKQ
ncbi:cold-shock protein [Paenibacillus sp. CCS19]|uniref:cold-shock protein n=1 Tax=Paenibacillus sp. CCS19 TaxID=3158387 RepID=UPI00295F3BEE|nr:cold-shock protein [Paenibacillus cellulosilyticus]